MTKSKEILELVVGFVVIYVVGFLVGLGIHTIVFGDPLTSDLLFSLSWQGLIYAGILAIVYGFFLPEDEKDEKSESQPESKPEPEMTPSQRRDAKNMSKFYSLLFWGIIIIGVGLLTAYFLGPSGWRALAIFGSVFVGGTMIFYSVAFLDRVKDPHGRYYKEMYKGY